MKSDGMKQRREKNKKKKFKGNFFPRVVKSSTEESPDERIEREWMEEVVIIPDGAKQFQRNQLEHE